MRADTGHLCHDDDSRAAAADMDNFVNVIEIDQVLREIAESIIRKHIWFADIFDGDGHDYPVYSSCPTRRLALT
ncbi:hypothetical protein ACO0LD_07490 [Undibacterium sp. Ji83W]|uniref:hypothetical protein n=1 Tax=Undibacterium sp. Ji83W TaxID=3413043 RepID=UPI003BF14382